MRSPCQSSRRVRSIGARRTIIPIAMPATFGLNVIPIICGAFYHGRDLLRRGRERHRGRCDGNIQVVGVDSRGLVEQITGESDSAAVCQGILKTRLELVSSVHNSCRSSSYREQKIPNGRHGQWTVQRGREKEQECHKTDKFQNPRFIVMFMPRHLCSKDGADRNPTRHDLAFLGRSQRHQLVGVSATLLSSPLTEILAVAFRGQIAIFDSSPGKSVHRHGVHQRVHGGWMNCSFAETDQPPVNSTPSRKRIGIVSSILGLQAERYAGDRAEIRASCADLCEGRGLYLGNPISPCAWSMMGIFLSYKSCCSRCSMTRWIWMFRGS